ncbi:MAG TPA: hypothetical protein VMD53_12515 [Rhizomicrobium sp.]|nr:hypothetical protein [Rhizomicrobium sp.]
MKLDVKPFYGWGWFDAKGGAVEVPPPFELDAQVIKQGQPFHSALGLASLPDHPLSNLWILLTQRHTTNDGDYNLSAFSEKPTVKTDPTRFSGKQVMSGFVSAAVISN